MYGIQRLLKLHKLMKPADDAGSNTGGTGTGSAALGAGEGDGKVGEGDAGKVGGESQPPAKTEPEGKPAGMSEGDAKLLKEVMKLKSKVADSETALREARERLSSYDGVDAAKAKQLLEKEKDTERQAAESRGEYDRLVKQMGERHTEEMKVANAALAVANGSTSVLQLQIAELTVGNAFGVSQFVAGDLTLTPSKARVIYGNHFEFKDGRVVGYDKPVGASERTVLVDSTGEPLVFDDAMRKLVDADPDRDQLLRSKAKAGASSSTVAKGSARAVADADRAARSSMSPSEKIAAGLKQLVKV
jgi:hypothetical protein